MHLSLAAGCSAAPHRTHAHIDRQAVVGWCTSKPKPVLTACSQGLHLQYDTKVSSVAFKFNLRPSSVAPDQPLLFLDAVAAVTGPHR